jgi:hypothetical protein
MDALPASIPAIFAGVDRILHLGDVTAESTLEQLRAIAPVEAVRGDHDSDLAHLPRTRVIEVEGRKLGLVHGNRSHLWEEPITFLGTLTLGLWWDFPGLDRWLLRKIPEADIVIHGHTHLGRMTRYGDRTILNPGGVFQITAATCAERLRRDPSWFEWCWLQVARHGRRPRKPSVGILEVWPDEIRWELIPIY